MKTAAHGRVLVVGGSKEYAGAPYLAGIAALRSGAESVIVMAPEKVAWTINALSPDLMTRKLAGEYLSLTHLPAILRQLKTADVLVIGNGATTRPGPTKLMRALMRAPTPKVIDADALKVLQKNDTRDAVLTPNEGEWKILTRQNDLKKLSALSVIVKKGRVTEIISAHRYARVRAERGLSKAGMGDILAGQIAGNLARGLDPFAAAKKACETGIKTAKTLARSKDSASYLASDVLRALKKKRR